MTAESETLHENCDHENWTRVGPTTVEGQLHVIWECTDCPAWTTEVKGQKWRISWHETPMHGGDD